MDRRCNRTNHFARRVLALHARNRLVVDRRIVEAAFDVNVPTPLAWEVLTDYEGIGRFVSSIRQSTIKKREVGRVLLEQHGVGRAWIVSLPMHVVLDVRVTRSVSPELGERGLAAEHECLRDANKRFRSPRVPDDRPLSQPS